MEQTETKDQSSTRKIHPFEKALKEWKQNLINLVQDVIYDSLDSIIDLQSDYYDEIRIIAES